MVGSKLPINYGVAVHIRTEYASKQKGDEGVSFEYWQVNNIVG